MIDEAGITGDEALMDKMSAYPDALSKLVLDFQTAPNEKKTEEIVIEILRYHQPDQFEILYRKKGDELELVSDLGMDSLTMMEITFEAEDFLNIAITNEEMLAIKTVADLKSYILKATSLNSTV